MLLRESEKILKVYRHHPVPFIMEILIILIVLSPFYIGLSKISDFLNRDTLILLKLTLILISILLIIHTSLSYWLDKLIITNERIIQIDWKNIINKKSHDVELSDIQHILVTNMGIIDQIPFLNYGTLAVHSGSNYETINFSQAPKPYLIQHFINKIMPHTSKKT